MDPAEDPTASHGTRLILGTAGHIDHGKTALIRALTGIDTDRLPEEKARGITIELGFAPLDLEPGVRVGVVDVPGHEGLVRTMVAGATGIDLVLLVVAADEGVMPQTREHVAICDLLGIERGVVALSKIDTVDRDVAELAEQEVRELLEGTPLRGAPIVPVSAATGAGLAGLREALLGAVRSTPPRTPRRGPPRLPVDRAFAARGFGAVVTGTLLGAPLRVGDPIEVLPGALTGRVRGLQWHGASAEAVEPGARCAVNVQGIPLQQLRRGQVLTAPGALAPTRVLDVQIQWLEGSPAVASQGTSIEFLAGTTERVGRLAPVGAPRLVPGETGLARLHLQGDPVPVLPGDRFVARGFARREGFGATLGGGLVLDVAPPRRRRSDPQLVRELQLLLRRDPEMDVAVRIARAGFRGATQDTLRRETGLVRESLDHALRSLGETDQVVRAGEHWISAEALEKLEHRVLEAVEAFHRREPLRPGMPRASLGGALPENAPPETLELVLARLGRAGQLRSEGERVRRPDHRPRLSSVQEERVAEIRRTSRAAGLEPPTLREWSQRLQADPEEVRTLLVHLEQEAELVRAPGDLWFDGEAVAALRRRVIERIQSQGPLDTPSYKRLIGTTRKHAVPLMELFDAERVTLRKGEVRLLRGEAS